MPKHYDENIRDDWNDGRLEDCRPENMVGGDITPDYARIKTTSEEERRLIPKLKIVKNAARKLAAGMVKGTLKYKKDNNSVREWIDYLKDDASDTLNYIYLLEDAYAKETGMATLPSDNPLGPLQDIWDAWSPNDRDIVSKPEIYFERLFISQLVELFNCRDLDRAYNELVDIMAVCLNYMRSFGETPDHIATIIRTRARERYKDRVAEILEKYAYLEYTD